MTGEPPSTVDVPDALTAYGQWVGWRSEKRDGKQTKIPIDPATGQYASSTDPETWGGFEAAANVVERGDGAGVGFVFTDEDPFVGVDLDDCRDPESGEPAHWAAEIIETLNSYTEVSPSGTGYHVLVRGTLPEGRNRHGNVELYETARYFIVTGAYLGRQRMIHERTEELAAVHRKHVAQTPEDTGGEVLEAVSPGTPTASSGSVDLSDDDLLEKARSAQNGQKFSALWRGDTSGYDSHSEADMALCCLLAFWTGRDGRRVDRLFRESGLLRGKVGRGPLRRWGDLR
jgi:primase-polymerase (primpol)-like protein